MSETPQASSELRVERRGRMLWLTITRQERRNAMSDVPGAEFQAKRKPQWAGK